MKIKYIPDDEEFQGYRALKKANAQNQRRRAYDDEDTRREKKGAKRKVSHRPRHDVDFFGE